MHIHVPKPLHGWRAFINEIGVIVVGILIALGAEQLIEYRHWLHQVDGARDTLRRDFTDMLVTAREREQEDVCIRRRLNEVAAVLTADTTTLPPLGHIGAPALRDWQAVSWASAVSSQIATHFPRDELLQISNVQTQASSAERTNAREMDDWAALYSVVGTGRKLDVGEASQLRRIIADAAYRNNLLRLDANQLDDAIVATRILTDDDLRAVEKGLQKILSGPNRRSLCGPIAPPQGDGIEAPYDPKVQPDPLHQ